MASEIQHDVANRLREHAPERVRRAQEWPLQFSLRFQFYLLVASALLVAWCYWLANPNYGWPQFFPGWVGLLPVALLAYVGFCASPLA